MISLIIPAYNEEDIVRETVEQAKRMLADHALTPYEIIVVDDGSTDSTAERAREAGARLISHPHNSGYGRSLKDGILSAQHDTIVISDADGTYPLERIPDLLTEYKKGFDMVIGARQGANLDSSFFKRVLRFFLKALVEFTTGRPIPDINSGLRVFSKKTSQGFFPYVSNAFSFTTSLTLAYMLSSKYVSFLPIGYNKRVGPPKVHLLRDSLRTLQYITEAILYYNPIKLFLVLAGIVGLLGAASILLSLIVSRPGFLYLGAAAVLMSFLIVSLGFLAVQIKEVLPSSRRE